MKKYTNNEVGSIYKKSVTDIDPDIMFMDIVATAIGVLGISSFILALSILPWSTL